MIAGLSAADEPVDTFEVEARKRRQSRPARTKRTFQYLTQEIGGV
jgi:hypothetical protein